MKARFLNPCIIEQYNGSVDMMESLFRIRKTDYSGYTMPDMTEKEKKQIQDMIDRDANKRRLIENARLIDTNYKHAVEILKSEGFEKAIDRMVYSLVPIMGEVEGGLSDQKVGGTPDIRGYLYSKQGEDGKFNTADIWPRCGCCHRRMHFAGQFDLYSWLLPIHAAFGQHSSDWGRTDEYSLVSGAASIRLVQHASIYETKMFHVFMCPDTRSHFEDLNFDARIWVTGRSSDRSDAYDKQDWLEATEAAYLESIPDLEVDKDNDWAVKAQKIEGWQFRFGFDGPRFDKSKGNKWDEGERLYELMDKYPDLFHKGYDDFKMFGEPRSQQDPRRFWSVKSPKARRLTPFLSFDDADADMTYQVYSDMVYTQGYDIHAKVDSSCT